MSYAFISYGSMDRDIVNPIKDILVANGIKTWIAPDDIPIGSVYSEVINEAIKNCVLFVMILTNESQRSLWIQRELERASAYEKTIVPIQIGNFNLIDEFDFIHGTIPPEKEKCAQFLIVEAYEDGSVRVLPYDILSGKFFNDGALIEKPFDPDSFVYTDKRYLTAEKPYFPDGVPVKIEASADSATVIFGAARSKSERINAYMLVLKCSVSGRILRQVRMTSRYYLYDTPQEYSFTFENLCKGEYLVEITAEGFWNNTSDKLTKGFAVI